MLFCNSKFRSYDTSTNHRTLFRSMNISLMFNDFSGSLNNLPAILNQESAANC